MAIDFGSPEANAIRIKDKLELSIITTEISGTRQYRIKAPPNENIESTGIALIQGHAYVEDIEDEWIANIEQVEDV